MAASEDPLPVAFAPSFPLPHTALTEPLCDSHFGLLALELMAARRGALPPYVSLDIPWSPRH